MTSAGRLELAAAARVKVARVIALLERPTVSALNESTVEASLAIERMEELRKELSGLEIACSSKPVIMELRKDLRRAGRLLRNAWELRAGGASQIEYSKEGEWVSQPALAVHWALEA